MTTQRDVMQAATMAALARYLETTGQRHDTIAARAYLDHILKAADRYAHGAAVMRQRNQEHAAHLETALAKVMQGTAS